MKRVFLLIVCTASLFLFLYPTFAPNATKVCAESEQNQSRRKASSDLRAKVNSGHGADLVRVIIQPAAAWDDTLESTVHNAGGNNVRQFQNLRFRVVTMSANAAANIASRSDVAYVSLNREVRSLGHLSRLSETYEIGRAHV